MKVGVRWWSAALVLTVGACGSSAPGEGDDDVRDDVSQEAVDQLLLAHPECRDADRILFGRADADAIGAAASVGIGADVVIEVACEFAEPEPTIRIEAGCRNGEWLERVDGTWAPTEAACD